MDDYEQHQRNVVATLPRSDLASHRLTCPAGEYQTDHCLHHLVETQVLQTPNSIAVVFGDQSLTYTELNRRANQLASQLREFGVGPEVPVAICAERSLEMVVGLLGILKAGGAYVPFDPSFPKARLAGMFSEMPAAPVLVQKRLMGLLPERATANAVILDTSIEPTLDHYDRNPESGVSVDDLAYIIYTSGSTGKPKGAMNQHSGIINRLQWMQEEYGLKYDDRVLQKTPYSFDVSVWEFFWPLITGACLVVAQPDSHKDPTYLVETINLQKITTIHFVPSMLGIFLRAEGLKTCRSLRRVFCSGEELTNDLTQEFFRHFDCELHNLYGPTEAAVDVTYWRCLRDDYSAIVPIGRPIANVQTYILDEFLEPVPIGAAGELYIGGVQVGRGYFGRPALTAERFVANPFGQGRMYKTGDGARRRTDGEIEFLGRLDSQVKIRGNRIELGEIEATIRSLRDVQNAVVTVWKDPSGDQQLIAYVVAPKDAVPGIRNHVKERLPEYMLPSLFVTVTGLPLNGNGKIDRKSLPVPDFASARSAEYSPPRSPIEEKIAAIWESVLGMERIGVDENFFEIGGHSLKAMTAVSRINAAFDISLPIRTFFDSATVAELAEAVPNFSSSPSLLPPIKPLPRPEIIPQSFAQQRLWLVDRIQPGRSAYNIPLAFSIEGVLNINALEGALRTIVLRHESLRTTLGAVDGVPVQFIHDGDGGFAVEYVEVAGDAPTSSLLQLVNEQANRPFDLTVGPLFRATLFKSETDRSVLLLNLHHSIFDGWSEHVLLNELTYLYAINIGESNSGLALLPIQYAAYSLWQRNEIDLTLQRKYWQSKLAGSPDRIDLRTDRPRPPALGEKGAEFNFNISFQTVESAKALALQKKATLFMVLFAAWALLLHRYSGQSVIVTGTPSSGRTRPELEDLIGFFVNTLALKIDFSDDAAFGELLEQVRDTTLDAFANQDYPFEKVIDDLALPREENRNPLIQTMFVLNNNTDAELQLPGAVVTSIPIERTTAKFDLMLTVDQTKTGLVCSLEYSVELYDAQTIERMASHFATILSAVVASPSTSVRKISYLGDDERRLLLHDWTNTARDYPRNRSVHSLFEDFAARSPDRIAAALSGRQITYGELNARANQLARHLQSLGATSDSFIPVLVDRSIEMLIALLAIMKSGAAYMPIDPTWPEMRINGLFANTAGGLVLTEQKYAGLCSATDKLIFLLDGDMDSIDSWSSSDLSLKIDPQSPAYALFTSGSTGVPKTVVVPHRAIVRLVVSTEYASFGPDEVVLHMAPLAFDASTFEIWGALLNGGRIALLSPGLATLQEIGEAIKANSVTTVWLTAGLFHSFITSYPAGLKGVKQLLAGGDVLSVAIAARALDALPGCRLINGYGPTENTTFTCCHQITERDTKRISIPIGKPISNTTVYILDPEGSPTPIGVCGELYAGGDGLALGYLDDPEATASKFVANPFEPNSRLYRTGDRARWLPSGEIEFVGRIDSQVKIRGFRIELGEIEAILRDHPNVNDTSVCVEGSLADDKRLIAYVASMDANEKELRTFLHDRLPGYMVPTRFVILSELPLNSNGKVDRNLLAAGNGSRSESIESPTSPGEEERALCSIWQQLLGIPEVGIHDDFWNCGGNSLLAISLFAEIENRFGKRLPISVLFRTPTIAGLAESLRSYASRREFGNLMAIKPGGTLPTLYCVHEIQGQSITFVRMARHIEDRQPIWGIEARGLDGLESPINCVEQMASHYIDQIVARDPVGPYCICGYSFGGVVAFEIAQQLNRSGRQVNFLGLFDTYPPEHFRNVAIRSAGPIRPSHVLAKLRTYFRLPSRNRRFFITTYKRHLLTRLRRIFEDPSPAGSLGKVLNSAESLETAHLEALRNYYPKPYSGKVTIFRAGERVFDSKSDPVNDWNNLAAKVSFLEVAGNHTTMLHENNIKQLAQTVSQCLMAASETQSVISSD